jgi:hypothetical protein
VATLVEPIALWEVLLQRIEEGQLDDAPSPLLAHQDLLHAPPRAPEAVEKLE